MRTGSLADSQGCRDLRVGWGCASCRLRGKTGRICWFLELVLELVLAGNRTVTWCLLVGMHKPSWGINTLPEPSMQTGRKLPAKAETCACTGTRTSIYIFPKI